MKAAPRICFCEVCQEDYGSCSLFTEYDITIKHLQQICLRLSTLERIGFEPEEDEPTHDEPAADVLLKDVVVSRAAENGSIYVLKENIGCVTLFCRFIDRMYWIFPFVWMSFN